MVSAFAVNACAGITASARMQIHPMRRYVPFINVKLILHFQLYTLAPIGSSSRCASFFPRGSIARTDYIEGTAADNRGAGNFFDPLSIIHFFREM
jgi:hypothetical protein